jgi:toxin YhaV
MDINGWTLLFHDCIIKQLTRLQTASERAKKAHPEHYHTNANVKLFRAVSALIFKQIPLDPSHENFRQGNTLGTQHRHWRRAKIGRRFRLFFRYDSNAKIIIFAWINDENTLRTAGSKNDPYAVFQQMLNKGNPPDDWNTLLQQSQNWRE